MKVKGLDEIFRFPSPLAIAASLWTSFSPLLIPSILIAIAVQSIVLVSIFAPNSLTINSGPRVRKNMTVPSLDFSQGAISILHTSGDVQHYTGPSAFWNQSIAKLITMPVDVNWNRPPGCGNSCKYSIEYKAPALECKDMGSDQVGPLVTLNDDGSIKDRYWYNTSTTLVPTGTVDLQKPYTLNIAYSNITGAVSVEPDHLTMLVGIDRPIGSGTTCTFRNATYAADFELPITPG